METETKQIFSKIYQDLKEEMTNNNENIFLKEYTIPSINYNPDSENRENMYLASGIEMKLYQMMKQFDYKVYFSSYKDKYFFSNSPKKAEAAMLLETEKETVKDVQEKQKLKRKFEEKINKEFRKFVDSLKQCDPEIIVNNAYELVSKQEMIYKITDKDYTTSELKALLKTKGILNECYDEWLKSDGNFNEILEYAVDNRIDLILDEFEEKNKQKIKESR